MKILIACEFSGIVREVFRKKGHDAYSCDINQDQQNKSYNKHDSAYRNIFDRCKIKYFVVGAHSGAMGGSGSEEFMVQSDAGEDTVAHCESGGYSANVEVATSKVEAKKRAEKSEEIKDKPRVGAAAAVAASHLPNF